MATLPCVSYSVEAILPSKQIVAGSSPVSRSKVRFGLQPGRICVFQTACRGLHDILVFAPLARAPSQSARDGD